MREYRNVVKCSHLHFCLHPQIRRLLIKRQFDLADDVNIDSHDSNFLEKYNINSIDALELLLMIESDFDVEIDDADLNSNLLSTIYNIADYIKNLLDVSK